MNKMNTAHTASPTAGQMSTMVQKIGNTTYTVHVYFSQTSKETFTEKVLRLIRNDIDTKGK